jgi:hypothetical protein
MTDDHEPVPWYYLRSKLIQLSIEDYESQYDEEVGR